MDDSLAFAPITKLSALIRRRELSPVELTDLYLERLKRYNPALNAYIAPTADAAGRVASRARAQARAAEESIAAGAWLGPLHGIPLAFKDLIDVAGLPTTGGSILRREHRAEADATVARRLFGAGAVLLGKTNMVEFAYGGTGVNHHYGTPVNPWDPATHRLPGGSSSGSGVAVAAGLAAAALGSDTGGSVRIPSSFCGLVGLKPTFGLLPNTGVLPLDPTLDSIGPLCRSAEDCALLHQVMAGPDPAAPETLGHPASSVLDEIEGEVAGLRLCFPREYFWSDVDEEVEAAVRASAQVFADLNVHVDEISLEVLDDLAAWRSGPSTTAVEAYRYHRTDLEEHLDQFDPIVSERILDGRDILASDFLQQLLRRDQLRRKARAALENVDFLITPTTPFAAPVLAEIDRDEVYFPTNGLCLRNTIPVNLLDLCAISLPCGTTRDGLPIGLQLIGHPHDDARLLRLAHAFEQATDYSHQTPDLTPFA
jgi:aspartyl-tRNA(Asn)/glutamyl-tRNA(Gln) amidotransferase subunit A